MPDLAAQTGQPCTMCHIGGFGPQLTPFGRAFKIGGYTQTGGDGWPAKVPLSLMVQSSFTNTSASLPADQIPAPLCGQQQLLDRSGQRLHRRRPGAVHRRLHAVHLFAGRQHRRRSTTPTCGRSRPCSRVGEHSLRIGVTLNNNPTVQDPYNSTFAWGFPFIGSAIAPTPTADVMLSGGFNGNSIGYTVYAWYDQQLYLEAGAYNTFSPWTLARIGNDYGIGATTSPAPYLRAAYEWNWNNQSAHVGALFMHADVNPPNGIAVPDRRVDGRRPLHRLRGGRRLPVPRRRHAYRHGGGHLHARGPEPEGHHRRVQRGQRHELRFQLQPEPDPAERRLLVSRTPTA